MFVKNWQQVFKSLAVWLPIIATAILALIDASLGAGAIPLSFIPVAVAISGALGWVIKQKGITNV